MRILYVDDEYNNLLTLQIGLKRWFQIDTAESGAVALKMFRKHTYQIVITDQRMPEMTGLQLAEKIKKESPSTLIIILTAFDDNDTMLKALNQGGIYRYLIKPVDFNDLKQTIDSAFEKHKLQSQHYKLINDLILKNKQLNIALDRIELLKKQIEEENIQLKQELTDKQDKFIIGQSQALKQTLDITNQVAGSDTSILLTGETGTGKELFAASIHKNSKRNQNAFIKINCAAIPENLLESELFGHEKGAFTSADKSKIGKFELADKGTIFLDEIGELSMAMQAKLLRSIQEKEIERIGSNKVIKIDVRIIAATNRDLGNEVTNGNFRADLFYRLNVIPIHIPPLRKRKEDIPLLIDHFIAKLNRKLGKGITSITSSDMKELITYQWPGNIRELENVIERSYILSKGPKLSIHNSFIHLPKEPHPQSVTLCSLAENEKRHIIAALKTTQWKIGGKGGAADLLDINPSTLKSRMKKLGIYRPL